MRCFSALVCLAGSVSLAFGYASDPPSPTPPVEIVKHSWYVDSGLLRDSSALAADAATMVPGTSIPGVPQPPSRQNSQRALMVPSATVDTIERPRSRDLFRYQMTLRNDSGKMIRKVIWSYVFLHPETRAVVARHRFATDTKIKPGKTKRLEGATLTPPSAVVDVRTMRRDPGWEKSERIEVFRIQFSDGTFWSRRFPASPAR
jgi:hypothetical protein